MENTKYLKCTKCGWIHYQVSREHAQEQVDKFNSYFNKLTKEQQISYYGGRPSSIASYENCMRCGTIHTNSVPATGKEVSAGATINPLIDPQDVKGWA